ncbi:hypothetical protein JOM56_009316 [Amanita muscaria]
MSSSQTVRKRLASLKLREQQEQERDKQRKREAEERSQEIAELEQREREEEENRRKAVEEEERRKKAKEAERRKKEIESAQRASLVSETGSMKQKRTVTLGEPLPMGACDRCIAGNQVCVRPQGRTVCVECRTRKKGCTISQASAKKKAVQLQKVASTSDEAEEDGEGGSVTTWGQHIGGGTPHLHIDNAADGRHPRPTTGGIGGLGVYPEDPPVVGGG